MNILNINYTNSKGMKPGIYDDIDINEYHNNRHIVSSTGLKKAKNSTRDFIWYVIHGTEEKLHFDFGNAFELALMDAVEGSNLYDQSVSVEHTQEWIKVAQNASKGELKSPKSTKVYRELKTKFREESFGKYIIPDIGDQSHEWIQHMVQSCMASNTIRKLLGNTDYQKTMVWKDKNTGVMCKTRPDICMTKKNVILDIKTTLDASPNGFAKQVANLDYPLQAIMQMRGCEESGLMDHVDKYFWLAVEKREPFNVGLYEFQPDDRVYFSDYYDHILERCAQGLKEISQYKTPDDIYKFQSYGEQAGNPHGILALEIPLWYKNGWL